MIDTTSAITPSAMSLGGIASSKRSVDNFCANSTRHGILVFLASALAGPWQLRRLHVAEHRGSSSRYEPSLAFHRGRRVDPSDCSRCSRLALHRLVDPHQNSTVGGRALELAARDAPGHGPLFVTVKCPSCWRPTRKETLTSCLSPSSRSKARCTGFDGLCG